MKSNMLKKSFNFGFSQKQEQRFINKCYLIISTTTNELR